MASGFTPNFYPRTGAANGWPEPLRRLRTLPCTAEGSCSWHQFARGDIRRYRNRVSMEVAAPNEFPAKVPRTKVFRA